MGAVVQEGLEAVGEVGVEGIGVTIVQRETDAVGSRNAPDPEQDWQLERNSSSCMRELPRPPKSNAGFRRSLAVWQLSRQSPRKRFPGKHGGAGRGAG